MFVLDTGGEDSGILQARSVVSTCGKKSEPESVSIEYAILPRIYYN